MKKINQTVFLSSLLIAAYLLSSCSGASAGQNADSTNSQQSQDGQAHEVVFTGTVDAITPGQWTVSGQAITIDGTTSVDANIVVGDNVKVEAQVAQDGAVAAVRIEISGAEDANSNSSSGNANESNANDNASNSNDNQADNSNSVNGNGNDNSSVGNEQEVTGVVEAITTDSITINGVTYAITNFTEFKDLIALGDQVKLHVTVNADGTFTIREIEKSAGTGADDSNSNGNRSDDNSNINSNTNGDDSGGNSNDGGGDNGNDDSGDNSNDSGGGNGNGNG